MSNKSSMFSNLSVNAAIAVLTVWIANWILVGMNLSIEKGGQFGDRFGASTSLFGGITIILLLYTINLQRQEIRDGKKEFKKQNKTMKIERIESTFLNLLKSHNNFVETLSTRSWDGDYIEGKYLFEHININIEKLFLSLQSAKQEDYFETYKTEVLWREESLQAYLRSIDIPLKYMSVAKLSEKKKNFYYSIVLSQLTRAEKLFLNYHLKYTKVSENANHNLTRLNALLNSGTGT